MKPDLTPKEAEITIQFLNRVDLKGSEAGAMTLIMSKLMAKRDQSEVKSMQRHEAGEGC